MLADGCLVDNDLSLGSFMSDVIMMQRQRMSFSLLAALIALQPILSSCGGEGVASANNPVVVQPANSQTMDLEEFLYKGESIAYKRIDNPEPGLMSALNKLRLNSGSIADIIFTSLDYKNTNLPAVSALLLSKTPNGSLIIYNHGHDGLPTNEQTFAVDFINMALSEGYSVLIDCMPLTGLNAPNFEKTYYINPIGSAEISVIDESLLQWPIIHQLYQAIAGNGNFMHFFVDGSVFGSAYFGGRNMARPFYFNSINSDLQFNNVHYVGLSGGGFAGLISCGLYRYRSCTLIAGFLPFKYKITDLKNWGDSEQYADSFFSRFSYESLISRARGSTERLTLIYNDNDSCCFSNPAVRAFKDENPELRIIINESSVHGFNPEQVLSLVRD